MSRWMLIPTPCDLLIYLPSERTTTRQQNERFSLPVRDTDREETIRYDPPSNTNLSHERGGCRKCSQHNIWHFQIDLTTARLIFQSPTHPLISFQKTNYQNVTLPLPTGPAVSSKIVTEVSNHPRSPSKKHLSPSNVSASINQVKSSWASGRLIRIYSLPWDHSMFGCGTGPSPWAATTARLIWYCALAMRLRNVSEWIGGPYLLKIRDVVVPETRIWYGSIG